MMVESSSQVENLETLQSAVNIIEGTLWGALLAAVCLGITFSMDKTFSYFEDKKKVAAASTGSSRSLADE